MDAKVFISPPLSPPASVGSAQAALRATPGRTELRGGDFADLLVGLRNGPQGEGMRQDLAAAGLAEAGLQAVALSPQLELITAATPAPDADSLLAFARTQGLDDGTLALLFGSGTVVSSLQGAAGMLAPAAWALGGGGSSLTGPIAGSGAPGLALMPGSAHIAGGAASTSAAALAAQAGALGLSDLSWQVSKSAGGLEAINAASATTSAETGMPDTLVEALRLQLEMPREAITALTRRLAGLAGNGQAVAWGQLQAQALVESPNILDMREFLGGQGVLIEPDLATEAGSPGLGGSAALDGGRTAAAGLTLQGYNLAQASQAGARLEHYQQLADKLGQALAQRLQAQIERGEWKLQMRMDPASLGRIDLELDMHANGLDAVFRSDNPLTRELIAQGLPKLRDSLSQSGTTVAHVWVNGDSAGQSGGNSTPQFANSQESQAGGGSVDAKESPVVPSTFVKRVSDSDWDVLA